MGELAEQALKDIKSVELVPEDSQEVDLVFSASYPKRITAQVCSKAKLGAVNIHTSLLPEGRGSHPLNWALIWGKNKTGITIHKIVDTYDAGDICYQKEIPIFEDDTIKKLRHRVEVVFPRVIEAFFEKPEYYIKDAKQQNQAHATYAQKRRPEDSQLNLDASPFEILNLFRSCEDDYPAFVVEPDGKKTIIRSIKLSMSLSGISNKDLGTVNPDDIINTELKCFITLFSDGYKKVKDHKGWSSWIAE